VDTLWYNCYKIVTSLIIIIANPKLGVNKYCRKTGYKQLKQTHIDDI